MAAAVGAQVSEELIPGVLTLGDVQKVLRNLLRERVPIRNLEIILESLADYGTAPDQRQGRRRPPGGPVKALTLAQPVGFGAGGQGRAQVTGQPHR